MGKQLFVAIIFIALLLTGCDPNAGTVDLTLNETSAEITEVTHESIYLNNCGGKSNVTQTAERSKSVHVEYGGEFGVDKIVISGEVSAKYGEINSTAKKMELSAPAGTNMEYSLEWTEKTWVGFVTAQGKEGEAEYKVSVPISIALVNSQDLGCDDSLLVLNIRPACGYSYTVESGKAIELHYGGWYADGLELGTENANHLSVTLLVDGQIVSGTKQPVQKVTSTWYPGASCSPTRDYSNAFGTFYIANIGTLTSGEHSVQIIYSFDKQVTDGGYDDNGNPVFYGPGNLDPLQFTIVANP